MPSSAPGIDAIATGQAVLDGVEYHFETRPAFTDGMKRSTP